MSFAAQEKGAKNCSCASDNPLSSFSLHDNEVMSRVVSMEASSPEHKPWSLQNPQTYVLNSEIYALKINVE
jgi:hypothetical protein